MPIHPLWLVYAHFLGIFVRDFYNSLLLQCLGVKPTESFFTGVVCPTENRSGKVWHLIGSS